ncbi:MAG TPA: hypothetical protein VLT36_15610 [Candidatus Dormibacteraeota bacterium]|nr:hypothetical protein [Candidatus Dormibacteraeota bacterium]
MLATKAEAPVMTEAAHRASFFRQSGWLMIANIAGGALMWAVHFLSRPIGPKEYGIFGVLLAVIMVIPTMPLQMVMAQQTAKALATGRLAELAGMIRKLVLATFLIWLVPAVVVGIFQHRIVADWGLTNPASLWITLVSVLLSVWMFIFWGSLQGQQNFLWLGWSMMLNGVGRLGIAALTVLVFGCLATGMMTGVLLGMVTAAAIACWQTRKLWSGPTAPFDWRSLVAEIIPPMVGFTAFYFLFTADTMFVKAYFSGAASGFYVSAGTLSRALLWLVGPLTSVMFPRIVHSTAKSEKSNLVGMVLLGTGIISLCGAIGLSVLGRFAVGIVSGPAFVAVAGSILPWYAFAMVPLALANVLLNNLLARSAFKVVIPLCILAGAYGYALTRFHTSLVMVLQTMMVFNLLLFALCAFFTWAKSSSPAPQAAQAA